LTNALEQFGHLLVIISSSSRISKVSVSLGLYQIFYSYSIWYK